MYKEHSTKTISNVVVVILTLVCATIAWVPAFITSPEPLLIQGGGSLYHLLLPSIEANPILSTGICLLLLLGIASIQCWHALHLKLVQNLSLLPALFILLFTGVLCSEHGISPGILAGICTYIAFAQIVAECSYQDSIWRALEMGIFLALASLFAPTYLLYLPLFVVGMHLLNRLTASHLFGVFVGFITPYILWSGTLYLTNQSNLMGYAMEQIGQQFAVAWQWPLHDGIILGIIGIVLCLSYTGFLHQRIDCIHARLVSIFIYVIGLGSLVLSCLYHNAHHSIACILFSSIALTQHFHVHTKKLTAIFFYFYIISILVVYGTQFLP